jgi:hypothetical protein
VHGVGPRLIDNTTPPYFPSVASAAQAVTMDEIIKQSEKPERQFIDPHRSSHEVGAFLLRHAGAFLFL